MTELSFPRHQARTRRFTLGTPRAFVISADGTRVLFLRSKSGSDALTRLYELDLAGGNERLVVDPEPLMAGGLEELPAEERARRERVRESSSGIVRFSADREAARLAFDLSGLLYLADVASGRVVELPVKAPAVDPRLSPSGELVAYVSAGALRVVSSDGSGDHAVAEPGEGEGGSITFGLAEFVAAEEMDRQEGYWWSPAGDRLLVARVDTSDVERRFIADPSEPTASPYELAYPAAGTPNAEVRLFLVPSAGTEQGCEVEWDRDSFEYVTTVSWSEHGLLVVVQSRDQRRMRVLAVDETTGATTTVREDGDEAWLDIVSGVPARLGDGALVWTADSGGARRLLVGESIVTPEALQVRAILGVDGDAVLFSGSTEPTLVGAFRWSAAGGLVRIAGEDDSFPEEGVSAEDGRWSEQGHGCVAAAACKGGTIVLAERYLDRPGVTTSVFRHGLRVATIASLAETPSVTPRPRLGEAGEARIRTAVFFPSGHEPGSRQLPVLMSPYGGPHAQMVLQASGMFLTAQWLADQGYCVVVADGRGTPGRGPEWDRAVAGDLAGPVLEDQVTALHWAAEEFADLDLSRVGIRGWSFGGYLAALAVLRRPDVFHAAVAGAPVTEWRLYDTHYTERYLGNPASCPDSYERTSLLGAAAALRRPLLLIHGLADDNVSVANTLQLSSALLAHGRQHAVLPLSGVTHMTPQEILAENLLLLELSFLGSALAEPAELAP